MNQRGERDGATLDVTVAACFRIGEDGLVSEYFSLVNDQAAMDAIPS